MKKMCLFFLATVLLACMAFTALADVKPGEEVTVSFTLNNTNAAYVRVVADYDKSVFDLVGYSAANGSAGANGIVMYDTKALPSGPLGTVTLKVKANAVPGTYAVPAVLAECYDLDENNGKASVSGGTVVVAAEATPAPTAAPTVKPTEKPTENPTAVPTEKPTEKPTAAPTEKPTWEPTAAPTEQPTEKPTAAPTEQPTEKPTAAPTEKPTEKPVPTPRPSAKPSDNPNTWRYNQTLSSLGIRFRDAAPALTDTWHLFTPLDVSKDGETVIPLIAGGISQVGEVTVAVADGAVQIKYALYRGVELLDIGCALFHDLDRVDTVDMNRQKQYPFRQTIRIAEDLDGDTSLLLYVFGHVNYDFEQQPIYRLNGPKSDAVVERLKQLMD